MCVAGRGGCRQLEAGGAGAGEDGQPAGAAARGGAVPVHGGGGLRPHHLHQQGVLPGESPSSSFSCKEHLIAYTDF